MVPKPEIYIYPKVLSVKFEEEAVLQRPQDKTVTIYNDRRLKAHLKFDYHAIDKGVSYCCDIQCL